MLSMEDIINSEDPWHLKAFSIKTFHEAKIKSRGNKRGNKWTLTDTAKALNLSIGYISEALILAEHPELNRFSRYVALKVLRNNKK